MAAFRGALLVLLLSASTCVFAQLPGKDLAFAQIAFGGGYETVMNVTNRGLSPYAGILRLQPSDLNRPFPALVNGSPVSGSLPIALNPGATASLIITSGDASVGTVTGFATVASTQVERPGLLDGNLTYYFKTANGAILDSVGVAPSRSILQSVVPFDDFQSVAVAIANPGAATATVRLTIFDETNASIGSETLILSGNQQVPKFLSQFFPGISLTRGRLEVLSDNAVLGTALTFVKSGQASSLPFLPSAKLYEFSGNLAGQPFSGQVYITVDLPYVTGYAVDTVNGEPQPFKQDYVTGTIRNGTLELFDSENGATTYTQFPGFDLLQHTLRGTVTGFFINPTRVAGQGTMTMTAVE